MILNEGICNNFNSLNNVPRMYAFIIQLHKSYVVLSSVPCSTSKKLNVSLFSTKDYQRYQHEGNNTDMFSERVVKVPLKEIDQRHG